MFTFRATAAVVSLLAVVATGCIPAVSPPDADGARDATQDTSDGTSAGDRSSDGDQPEQDTSPAGVARADRALADSVCDALVASFSYAFETLNTDVEADRASALIAEYTQRRAPIEVPQRHRDDLDRIDRGLELFVLSGGFSLDGIEPADADERDERGEPVDLWLHLDDERFAAELSSAPSCVEIATRHGADGLFATDGWGAPIPAPSTDVVDDFDAFEILGEVTRRAFVLAAADQAESSLHSSGFAAEVFGPLSQLDVVDETLVTSDGLVTVEFDPDVDGADAMAAEAGGLRWCVQLPAGFGDGVLLLAPGDCTDAEVRDELAAQLQDIEGQGGFDDGDDGGFDDGAFGAPAAG